MLSQTIVDFVEETLETVEETTYTHDIHIDPGEGVYDVDCSGFVSFVLTQVAPRHGALLPDDPAKGRPLAGDIETFIAGLPTDVGGPWQRIAAFADARQGDIVAWRRRDAQGDTGHVFFVAGPPMDQGGFLSVFAYDSSNVPHFNDSRQVEGGEWVTGVGSGTIRFTTDPMGAPVTFQFNDQHPPTAAPIVVGRLL